MLATRVWWPEFQARYCWKASKGSTLVVAWNSHMSHSTHTHTSSPFSYFLLFFSSHFFYCYCVHLQHSPITEVFDTLAKALGRQIHSALGNAEWSKVKGILHMDMGRMHISLTGTYSIEKRFSVDPIIQRSYVKAPNSSLHSYVTQLWTYKNMSDWPRKIIFICHLEWQNSTEISAKSNTEPSRVDSQLFPSSSWPVPACAQPVLVIWKTGWRIAPA